jgi:uncharacterized membrane protein YbhN (UPF0104 family)
MSEKQTYLTRAFQQVRALTQHRAVRTVAGGLALSLSFGYLASIVIRNWSQLTSYDWQVDWVQAALAFGFYTITLACTATGWALIMRRVANLRGWTKHLKYYTYTNLFRRLPVPWFYVVGRAVLYEREGITRQLSTALSLFEWVLIVLSGLLVYVCTLPFQSLPSIWRSPWVLAGILVVGALLARPRTLQAVQRLLGKSEPRISYSIWNLLAWLVLYCVAWVGGGLLTYAAIRSIYPLPIAELPSVIGAWTLSGLVTTAVLASAAGLGVKEVTMTILLGYIIPPPLAVVVAVATRVGITLFEMVWGAIALVTIR